MPDLRISQLTPITGGDVEAQDVMPVADISGSTTKKVRIDDLSSALLRLIPPGSFDGSRLATDTVTAAQLAPDSVGASELANSSVDSAAIQLGAVTNVHLASGIDGAKLTDGTLDASKLNSSTVGRGLDITGAGLGISNSVTPGTASGITWNAQGLVTGFTALPSTDLPIATTTLLGGVMVPSGGGLTVSPTGGLSVSNVISPGTANGITWDEHGHITAASALTPADLPVATPTTVGAITVAAGSGLLLSGAGSVTLAPSGIAPGSYARITVNSYGQATAGGTLTIADIPDLPASKITSGEFAADRYLNRSITQDKLADYAVSYIQEAEPLADATAAHRGMLWFQESTGALRMWNGNSWFPVGFGRLAQDNLRWGGLFDASTGLVTGVTNLGVQAGMAVGGPIPAATDLLGGLYLVCETGGNGVAVTPGITYDPGDWVLCVNQTNGWTRIDTLTGGGGGGGADYLNDLLDVTINNPQTAQVLTFNAGSGQWLNQNLPAAPITSVFGRSGAVVAVEGDYSLNLLGDVTLTTPTNGNLLQFNGTQWVNVPSNTVGGVTSVHGRTGAVVSAEGDYTLTQLGDVTLTAPANGQVLQYNGTQWVNVSQAPSGVTSVTVTAPITDTGTAAVPNIGISAATGSAAGSMSAADKTKLDGAIALATPSTLMARDANGSVAVNVMTATVFDLDALPELP